MYIYLEVCHNADRADEKRLAGFAAKRVLYKKADRLCARRTHGRAQTNAVDEKAVDVTHFQCVLEFDSNIRQRISPPSRRQACNDVIRRRCNDLQVRAFLKSVCVCRSLGETEVNNDGLARSTHNGDARTTDEPFDRLLGPKQTVNVGLLSVAVFGGGFLFLKIVHLSTPFSY